MSPVSPNSTFLENYSRISLGYWHWLQNGSIICNINHTGDDSPAGLWPSLASSGSQASHSLCFNSPGRAFPWLLLGSNSRTRLTFLVPSTARNRPFASGKTQDPSWLWATPSYSSPRTSLFFICSCAFVLYAFAINYCFNQKIVSESGGLWLCIVIVRIHYLILTCTPWWGNSRTRVRKASVVGADKLSWPPNRPTSWLLLLISNHHRSFHIFE